MLAIAACTLAGSALLALALRDIFDALFHPEGHAHLSRLTARLIWRVVAAVTESRGGLSVAGPLAVFVVIAVWALLFVLGFAVIYLPHLDGGFGGSPTIEGGVAARCAEAIAVSLQLLTTLGFADVVPQTHWLRMFAPVEALIGFGLLSASISWLLTAHPVLARRRELAYEVYLIARTARFDETTFARDVTPLLRDLLPRLVVVERDLVAFPVTFYFAVSDARFALAAALPALERARQRLDGAAGVAPDLKEHARVLGEALDDLAATLATHLHLRGDLTTGAVFDAYARAHRVRSWIGGE